MTARRTGISGRLRAPLFCAAAIGALTQAGAAQAQQLPSFALPVDCVLGESCYIQQYVDRDPGPGVRDFACGPLANDGHKGTDFAITTDAEMARGVAVLAVAPGTVMATRDGMADIRQGTPEAPDVSDRECGNGMVIDHGGGWETQYCHLREGSVSVARGDRVVAGTPLGLIGLSGAASFPHVHLSVRKDGAVIDPFRPGAGCGAAERPLWADPIAYDAGGIIAAGVGAELPTFDAIKAGLPMNALPPSPDAFVMWVYLANGLAGDGVSFRIEGPTGLFGTDAVVLEKDQPFVMRAWGRRARAGGLAPGTWVATARLERDGAELDSAQVIVTLP